MPSFTSAVSALFIAFLANSLVTAQDASTTVIQVIAAGTTQPPTLGVAGSIVGVNAVATTIAIVCTSSNTDCPVVNPWTVTQGPSTFSMSAAWSTYSEGLEVGLTIDENCKITSSTAGATCTNSIGVEASYEGQSSSTNSIEKPTFAADEITYQTLLITGGVEKFSQPSATQTPVGAAGRIGIGMEGAALVAGIIAIGLM
jgi:hypothetical protein